MAKLSRNILKGLVKECLVEILTEGLSAKSGELLETKVHRTQAKRKSQPRRVAPDLINIGADADKASSRKNAALEQRIKAASGGNNIMESILRDTAQNTLPNMVAAEGKKGGSVASRSMAQRMTSGDVATKTMATADPMDVFEGASNWASLAFAEDTRK